MKNAVADAKKAVELFKQRNPTAIGTNPYTDAQFVKLNAVVAYNNFYSSDQASYKSENLIKWKLDNDNPLSPTEKDTLTKARDFANATGDTFQQFKSANGLRPEWADSVAVGNMIYHADGTQQWNTNTTVGAIADFTNQITEELEQIAPDIINSLTLSKLGRMW